MEIDERLVPDYAKSGLCELVDEIKPGLLVSAGKDSPWLFDRHRPIGKNVDVARHHIKQGLQTDKHLNSVVHVLLKWTDVPTALRLLDRDTALASFGDFATVLGEERFCAAALLDERKELRDAAFDFTPYPEDDDHVDDRRARARNRLNDLLRPLQAVLDAVGKIETSAVAQSPVLDAPSPDTLMAIEAAKAESARLTKAAERDRTNLQAQIDRLKRELHDKSNEVARIKGEVTDLRKENRALITQRDEQQLGEAQRIAQAIEAELSSALRRWLKPVQAVDQAVSEAQAPTALGRAAEALKRQSATDLRYGNRKVLEAQIRERREMLTALQVAQTDALNPIPELAVAMKDLQRELSQLESVLGKMPENPTLAYLLAAINRVGSFDELMAIRSFVRQGQAIGILDRGAARQAYGAADASAARFYDRHQIDGQKTQFSTSADLRVGIFTGAPMEIVIDGHNVLFTLDDIFGETYEKGAPGAASRRVLVQRLSAIFDATESDVRVHFDGPDAFDQTISDQVRVSYSGGAGAHRADDAIVKYVKFAKLRNVNKPVWVVTNDRDLGEQTHALGAGVINTEEFAVAVGLASGG